MTTATLNPASAEVAPASAPAGGNALATTAGTPPAATGSTQLVETKPSKADPVLIAQAKQIINQPAVRKALPGIIALTILILFGMVYMAMNATPYKPVMPGLSESDQQAAFDALRKGAFEPRIDASTGQLQVPNNRYHEARIFLASQGLPRGGTTGLEALKGQSSMTTSQFMEQVQVNAAMEQELARTILQIATIQSARVHLAAPKQSVFVRDRTPPKASVVVSPHPGRAVSASQVQAIVHLVSSSVPYLTADHVTVVDNVGKLMTESTSELKLGLTAAQTQHKQQLEEVYRNRIIQILAPMVGEANVRSQVNLTLDFTQIESTTEDYDTRDKGPKTRSEVLAEDRGAQLNAEGVPGALSNRPPAQPTMNTNTSVDTNKGQTDSNQTLSSRQTRNYELDRTIRRISNATGGVQQVSVAVVINERAAPASKDGEKKDGKAPATVSYSPQEMERMQELVRSVVGFQSSRGDVVSVVPARFEPNDNLDTIPWYTDQSVQDQIKMGLIGLIFIVFLFIVVRPLMLTVTGQNKQKEAEAAAKKAMADGELSEEDMRMIQIGEGESLEDIKAKLKPKKSSISIDMLDTANTYDDKVALIRMLVAEDSARVANVLKGMITIKTL
jgi:flagellar M-ring protein FliF